MAMAYSSSNQQAYEVKLCELCKEDLIKWRCIDCKWYMCEKCKISHLKIQETYQHKIVTIGTQFKYDQKKIVIDNLPCKDHPKKMTRLFCKSCDSLICEDCATSRHDWHKIVPIELALDEKLNYLRGIYEKIGENLKQCESKSSEVRDIKPRYNATFDESLTKIKQKEQELIDSIKQYSKDLQAGVENERSKVKRIISEIEQDVENTKMNLEYQRNDIGNILTSNQGSVIFKATMKIKDAKFHFSPDQVQQFIPETESTKKIQALFGTLQMLSIPINFSVIRSFTSDLPFIGKVVTFNETSAWINCSYNQKIRKVNIQDNNMTTSEKMSLPVLDMDLINNNELLLVRTEGSDVKLLKRSGEIMSFMSVAPLQTHGIHVTKDNDVILSVVECSLTAQSTQAVIVHSMEGKQKHKYHKDNDGKRLFNYPANITTNRNQDIIVIDITSDSTGKVVVLNKEGHLRWIYEGNLKINASKQFCPRDIATTTVGHIIVSDFYSDALHVLSEDGEVLTCKVMRDMGIINPIGLDIDCEGKLWLGCSAGGEETGAKLHIINLF